MHEIIVRPRRNRKNKAVRNLLQEHKLHVHDLVLPLFICEGKGVTEAIPSMPGCCRYSLDHILTVCREAMDLGIQAVALFPKVPEEQKDRLAKESANFNGLIPRAVREIKRNFPDLCVITDVAMDPYSTEGHDGLVQDDKILNDETLPILGDMALVQAASGADFVAPSDMMDGRVGYLRKLLDSKGFYDVGILAYSAKYASAFYGPFRDALDSAPKSGDKKTYQMDSANSLEALRELSLDLQEGADVVMVKPALAYLDVIHLIKEHSDVPVAAYNVSGEYAMIKAAAERGWLHEKSVVLELLLSMKRAGADLIFTYHALDAAKWLQQDS